MAAKTNCRICGAEILQTTADSTDNRCMPCWKDPGRIARKEEAARAYAENRDKLLERMNTLEFEIDFEQIKARIHQCINQSFELIDSNPEFAATSYGVSLDTRFGRFLICLNKDDDESYRCDELGTFTGPTLYGVNLVQVDEFREIYESSESNDQLRIRTTIDGCPMVFESEEFDQFLYDNVILWIKEAFANLKKDKWLPFWIRFEEHDNGKVEHWRCREDSLPKERAWTSDPIEGQRIERAREKICVYKVSYKCRKYVGFDFEKYTPLDGKPLEGTGVVPLKIRSQVEMLRFGDLAPMGHCKDFAVNLERPTAAEIKEFLGGDIEFVPFEISGGAWEFCNRLSVCDVLNLKTTRFENRPIGNIRRIDEIEFDAEKLACLKSKVFRVAEWPQDGVYFLSSLEHKGLLEFCEERGLRGIGFNLVWTSDSENLRDLVEEFRGLVVKRLLRLHGNAGVKDSINVECLYGYQKDLWRLIEAERIFQEQGSRGLIENVQGLRDLKNPAIRALVPENWYWFNKGNEGAVADKLEQEFSGRSLLEGLNGYLSRMLPKGIRDITNMEATNPGRMAIFGPEI